jgi:hypothetical protein
MRTWAMRGTLHLLSPDADLHAWAVANGPIRSAP